MPKPITKIKLVNMLAKFWGYNGSYLILNDITQVIDCIIKSMTASIIQFIWQEMINSHTEQSSTLHFIR